MPNIIRIFIAEDHSFIIDAFKTRFSRESDFEFAGRAINLEELLERINTKVDILIFDNIVENRNETLFLKTIKELTTQFENLRIIVFSVESNLNFAKKSLEAGARGYLSKSLSMDEICEAIRKVYKGRKVLELSDDIDFDEERDELKELFTFTQKQVISLMCKGFNNQEVADFLTQINNRRMKAITVEAHRRDIRKKGQRYGITNDATLGYKIAKYNVLDGSELSSEEDKE